ncbi:hypothetical protein DDR56_13770 [Halomonas venusta]|uniref:Uncharacterized protein n=1 Tax=Vreelandella venusta TaxID=44935 RepID=A0ABX2BE05_9GAMM|nr:hypothetical protein [Halomonas venusta]
MAPFILMSSFIVSVLERPNNVVISMTNQPRKPLSDEEIAYLEELANGNALAKQRRREKKRQPPATKKPLD